MAPFVLIALLALLGVNLVVVFGLLVAVLGRRRWVQSQDGAFRAVAHLTAGALNGLGARPRRGCARWVSDVLIWTHAPLYLRNSFAAIDGVEGVHPSGRPIRRLGDSPLVVTLTAGNNRIAVAVRAEDRALALAPFVNAEPHTTVERRLPTGTDLRADEN